MSYAVILVHDHPQRDSFPQQEAFFNERILPRVTALPGFKSGNWAYDAGPSRTHSFVVFDTEANAKRLYDQVQEEAKQPNPFGVALISATLARQTLAR
jgi:hypothetical protein